jgi:hypothetical protein
LASNGQADDLHRICHHFVWLFDMRDKVESHAVINVQEFSADYVALVYPNAVTGQVLLNHPTSATDFCYDGSCEHYRISQSNDPAKPASGGPPFEP